VCWQQRSVEYFQQAIEKGPDYSRAYAGLSKSVYFQNQTGPDAVGKNALAQLKKWGKFQLVADPKLADLIFLLSADPYKGGNIIYLREWPDRQRWRPPHHRRRRPELQQAISHTIRIPDGD
jgi:hypothetical protein